MLETQNSFLNAINTNSEKQENITENEWNKINKDKTKILSKVSDSKKEEFESKYQELDDYFKHEWYQVHKTTVNDLKLFKNSFKIEAKSNNDVKNEFISKYSSEYKNLQSDVVSFLNKAFNNSLDSELWDFNIDKFNNKDKKEGFSEFELEQYAQILDKAMNHMNILSSYSDFKEEYKDINKEPDFLSWKWDIALANKVDLQEHVFWEWEKYLTENLHNYSEEELHLMREEKFNIIDWDKMKNFIVLLWLELWDWIQDILKFLWNMPAWLILLPRYISNRTALTDDKVDTRDEVEAQMENDMILKENPSLMLCELLWEKGIQMIKQLWEMFVSWKNGDIAMVLVTIAWLLAWWAWLVKLWAKWAKMTKTANIAEKIQTKAAKVDDIVWWAGIWHMTGEFSSKTISNDIIVKNGNLNDWARIEEAEKVLWRELTIEQKEALLGAHNYWSDKIWNYTTWEKVVKWKKLLSVGFTRLEAQKLMDQGIAWVSSRMLPSYEPWSIVNIKRSDWRIHEAKIWWVNDKWQLITFWEEWWVYMEKSFSPNQLDKINLINNIDFDINKANSIEELFNLIDKQWKIWDYDSIYLKKVINMYLNWEIELNTITRTSWLRDKVLLLKNSEFINKSVLKELWPNWLDTKTSQWPVWNCYFVAWLNSVKNHPNWWKLLEEMITIKSNWDFEVHFKWYYKPITISLNDINEMWRNKIDSHNIWDIVIERAHARVVNDIKWWKKWQTMFFRNNENELIHEWWNISKVLELFYWNNINISHISDYTDWKKRINKNWKLTEINEKNWFFTFNKNDDFWNFVMENLDEKNFMWLSSKSLNGKTDADSYVWLDFYWKKVDIAHWHAYTIYDFNKKEWWVSVVNPWDSSQHIKYSINDISKYFWWITIWEFKN